MGNEAIVDIDNEFNELNESIKELIEHDFNNTKKLFEKNNGGIKYNEINNVTPGFLFSQNQNENFSNFSDIDGFKNDDIINRIVNDDIIKELGFNIRSTDINLSNGLILVNINHNNIIEPYRFDIIGDKLFIQAPLCQTYEKD